MTTGREEYGQGTGVEARGVQLARLGGMDTRTSPNALVRGGEAILQGLRYLGLAGGREEARRLAREASERASEEARRRSEESARRREEESRRREEEIERRRAELNPFDRRKEFGGAARSYWEEFASVSKLRQDAGFGPDLDEIGATYGSVIPEPTERRLNRGVTLTG